MPASAWLEVSLVLDGELAEAAAEVLARFAPNGVAIESTAVTAGPEDEGGRAVGPLRVCAYLPVDEHLEDTRRRLDEALWYLGRILPMPEPAYRHVQDSDWAEAWKQHYHPVAIGQRLEIVPAWLENPEPGRIAVRMDPGMAFGTGTHPTTQLCLELVENLVPQASGPLDVIDVGCGSGILAVAALKLGAHHALAVDIDQLAVDATLENAQMNGVLLQVEAGLGSVIEVSRGDFSLRQAGLVLANILAPVIVRLFDDGLAGLVAPSGHLVLSGILAEQSPEVEKAATHHGLRVSDRRQVGDWVALALNF